MTLEAVLVSALLLAHLTVPSQLLKPLGLHLIGDVLWGSNYKYNSSLNLWENDSRRTFGSRHGGWRWQE